MSQFRRIGAGSCGSVWSPQEDETPNVDVYKREDMNPGRSVKNDCEMHARILFSTEIRLTRIQRSFRHLDDFNTLVRIPQRPLPINEDDEWWSKNLARFPEDYRPCNTLRSERIQPFSRPVREFLMDKFCPTKLLTSIIQSKADEDCLIRPYLGRRRIEGKPEAKFFTLRNLPLHLDQLEKLLPERHLHQYARLMGTTLAVLHWEAKVDANDVEFVLAPPRSDEEPAMVNVLGKHVMWILDFDLCQPLERHEDLVSAAVKSFMNNDPYFPRPGQADELWSSFRTAYLKESDRAIGDCPSGFEKNPTKIMDGIEEACGTKAAASVNKPLEEYSDREDEGKVVEGVQGEWDFSPRRSHGSAAFIPW